jgi:hypothetical protein
VSLFNLKHTYHTDLCADAEFEHNPNRCYIIVGGIPYKNRKISVAIPLRSNINAGFQSKKDEYIATVPTGKTRQGFIAGWHITKAIPIDGAVAVKLNIANRQDLQIAEKIAKMQAKLFKEKTTAFIKRVEAGEKIFGAIDFDAALQKMDVLAAQIKEAFRKNVVFVKKI